MADAPVCWDDDYADDGGELPDFCDCDDCWGDDEPDPPRPVVDVTAFAEAGLL